MTEQPGPAEPGGCSRSGRGPPAPRPPHVRSPRPAMGDGAGPAPGGLGAGRRPCPGSAMAGGPERGSGSALPVAIATASRLRPPDQWGGERGGGVPPPGAGRGVSAAPEAGPQRRRVCVRAPSGRRAPSRLARRDPGRGAAAPPGEGPGPLPAGPARAPSPSPAAGLGPLRPHGSVRGRPPGPAPRLPAGRARSSPAAGRGREAAAGGGVGGSWLPSPSNGVTLPRPPLRSPGGRCRLLSPERPALPRPGESLAAGRARPRTPVPSGQGLPGPAAGAGRRRFPRQYRSHPPLPQGCCVPHTGGWGVLAASPKQGPWALSARVGRGRFCAVWCEPARVGPKVITEIL